MTEGRAVRTETGGGSPRVVVLSGRGLRRQVWHASQFEFEDVISEVDDIRILAPGARTQRPAAVAAHQAVNQARRLGPGRRSLMAGVGDPVPAELFFAVVAAPHELGDLPSVREHIRAARIKVAFVVELWSPQVPRVTDYLKQLRGFDHVFVFGRQTLPMVQEITGVPCSYLPTAVDMVRFAPRTLDAPRPIDVSSYGQRLAETHAALVGAAARQELFYAFDTAKGPFPVADHREHRLALAQQLQHSRYAVVYRNNDGPNRLARTAGEETLTNRQFEVLASGAVLLGSRPQVGDFEDCFGWPDALVEIPAPAPDIVEIVRDLELQGERMGAARRRNVEQSLRRHDWAHRWAQVLRTVGLEPSTALGERLAALESAAAASGVSA